MQLRMGEGEREREGGPEEEREKGRNDEGGRGQKGKRKETRRETEVKKDCKRRRTAASTRTPEQKFAEEVRSVEGPATQECGRDTVIRMIEENEAYRKIIECVEGGSDDEVEAKIQAILAQAISAQNPCCCSVQGESVFGIPFASTVSRASL